MGRELMVDYPSFLANIRSMDKVLQNLHRAPPWSIEGINSRGPTLHSVLQCTDPRYDRYSYQSR